MYDDIIKNIAYSIIMDKGIFSKAFYEALYFIGGTFFSVLGIKLGLSFIRDSVK